MRLSRVLILTVLGTLLWVSCGDDSKITSVVVSGPATSMPSGKTIQLTATAMYSNKKTVPATAATWSSSDSTTASVDTTGLVKGLKAGTVTITANYKNANGTIGITVTAAVLDSFTTSATTVSLAQGLTQTVTLSGTMSDGTAAGSSTLSSCTWTSSNTSAASLSVSTGASSTVNSVGQGSSTVTVTCGAIQHQITVTVTAPVATALAVSPTNPSIAVGATQQFAAKATMTDGSTLDMTATATWTSSNTTYVSMDTTTMGLAHGLAAGGSTITASVTSGGHSFTDSTVLTVAQQPATGTAPYGLLYVWPGYDKDIYVYGIQTDDRLLAMPIGTTSDGDNYGIDVQLDPTGSRIYSIDGQAGFIAYAADIDFTTGALTPISGSPFTLDSNPNASSRKLLFDASKHWLYADEDVGYVGIGKLLPYVWDSASGSVSTPALSSYLYDGDYDILQDWKFVPDDSILYTVSQYIAPNNYLERMVVDPTTGGLTGGGEIQGTPNQALPLVIHPNGKFLYVQSSDSTAINLFNISGTTPSLVSSYTIDTPIRLAIFDSIHNLLFVVEQTNPATAPKVVSYAADYSTGVLTPAGSLVLDTSVNLYSGALALSPDGDVLYAGGRATNGNTTVLVLLSDPQTHAITQLESVQMPRGAVPLHLVVAAAPAALRYNAGVVNGVTGAAEAYQAYIRIPATSSDSSVPTTQPLVGDVVVRVKVYVGDFSPTSTMKLQIYQGSTGTAPQLQPVILRCSQTIDPLTITPNSWNTITVTEPVLITNDDLWIGFSVDESVSLGIDGIHTTPIDGAHMYNAVNGWTYIGGLWDIEASFVRQIDLR